MDLVKTVFVLLITFAGAIYLVVSGLALSLCKDYVVLPNDTQLSIVHALVPIYAYATAYCVIAGELTKNVSQVDRLWSIIPAVYAGYAAYFLNFASERANLMMICVVVWSVRLTYNFSRRGGYSSWLPWEGDEDYRWELLRGMTPFKGNPIAWSLFNIFFICVYQMGLLLLITLPVIFSASSPISLTDFVLAGVFLALVLYEATADNQQYAFQTEKYRRINSNEVLGEYYGAGFITTGLWAFSRHPNYFAEQSIWIVFYGFSVSATGAWFNPTGLGAVLLVLLFQGSAQFSEEITAKKYPLYKKYQDRTSCFVPFPWLQPMSLENCGTAAPGTRRSPRLRKKKD